MSELPTPSAKTNVPRYILASRQPLGESLLWQLQSQYFAKRGARAWQFAEVPFYVTSNPVIANSYAQVVWAFRQDRQELGLSDRVEIERPILVCELGAGSGTFAFAFIRRMIELCQQVGESPSNVFRYVLTDAAKTNLTAWQNHPCFSEWISDGLLDIAHFDITQNHTMTLQTSGETLVPGGLVEPFVVIANYLFDSVPQDLFYLNSGCSQRCLLSLTLDEDPSQLDEAQVMAKVHYQYDYEPGSNQYAQDPTLRALKNHYEATLNNTHILIPEPGWKGIQRLTALAQGGMLLLAADKGSATLEALDGQTVPHIQSHGSVSLPVNIHALRWLTEYTGGLSLAAVDVQREFTVFALLRVQQPDLHQATRVAFTHQVEETRPSDFYQLSRLVQKVANQMTIADILSYAHLSRYDSEQFKFFLPQLLAQSASIATHEKVAVLEIIEKVWAAYFPLGEEIDLAYHLGCILYEMASYQEALRYFSYSQNIYGIHTGTMFNMAVCHWMMGNSEEAVPLLQCVLQIDKNNEEASQLLQKLSS